MVLSLLKTIRVV